MAFPTPRPPAEEDFLDCDGCNTQLPDDELTRCDGQLLCEDCHPIVCRSDCYYEDDSMRDRATDLALECVPTERN